MTERELRTLHIAYTKMTNLELRKHIEPKFSESLRNIAEKLKLGS